MHLADIAVDEAADLGDDQESCHLVMTTVRCPHNLDHLASVNNQAHRNHCLPLAVELPTCRPIAAALGHQQHPCCRGYEPGVCCQDAGQVLLQGERLTAAVSCRIACRDEEADWYDHYRQACWQIVRLLLLCLRLTAAAAEKTGWQQACVTADFC